MGRRNALAVAVAIALVSGCGAGHVSTSSTVSSASTVTSPTAPVPAPVPKPKRARKPKPRPDPGALPQTGARPSADTPTFHAEMAMLWRAVVTGDAAAGRGAFFPEAAYAQVKAIADPRADFRDRLLGRYALDIAAAHELIAGHTASARLVRVSVPDAGAHWVPPGVCANRVGYWEVPNARVVYTRAGEERSFGIASMISWRGAWYVVHLGAVVPTSAGGVVDDPEVGPGVSAPSSTC